ncbi:type II toxin-antitoxin system VapC family toxin [Nocardiopsis sp. CC223A]|uniref:type II toxin-antitoxin system VapC family toxin n=1 Tax=Nocardiopsis sp. CC223A TaxID=3044051 RepID=UPI00278C461F|nr:type II toxin-antitoxin system VapC family toxin [Nocardiopsis sp. CC223A]
MRFVYLDTCAALKLFKEEVESEALERWLNDRADARQITSYLTRTELRRALHAAGARPETLKRAAEWSNRTAQLRMPAEVFDAAGELSPGTRLRSLDALHVACALGLGTALIGFVTYDVRLAKAAEAEGLPVVSPEPR